MRDRPSAPFRVAPLPALGATRGTGYYKPGPPDGRTPKPGTVHYVRTIERLNAALPRDRVEGEGRSIYFYDHDNHLFELHTGTLEMRLESYRKILDERRAAQ